MFVWFNLYTSQWRRLRNQKKEIILSRRRRTGAKKPTSLFLRGNYSLCLPWTHRAPSIGAHFSAARSPGCTWRWWSRRWTESPAAWTCTPPLRSRPLQNIVIKNLLCVLFQSMNAEASKKALRVLFEFNLNPEVCGKYTSSSKVQTKRFVFSTASQQNTEERASNGLRTLIQLVFM